LTPRRIFAALKPPLFSPFFPAIALFFSIAENHDKRCSLAAGKPIDFRPTSFPVGSSAPTGRMNCAVCKKAGHVTKEEKWSVVASVITHVGPILTAAV
jgi:hypothetical protein